jgi:peptide/nickel transport system ATP-binding protein
LNLLSRLQESLGLSYLFITHNLAVARHMADRIAIMYLGRIVEIGPSEAVFGRPAHPYTRCLLEARESEPLGGEVPGIRQRPLGCEFHTRCPKIKHQCLRKRPFLLSLGDRHFAACHLVSDAVH